MSDVETQSTTQDLVGRLASRWKTLLVFALLGGGASLAYGQLAPKWYEAQLSVVPSQRMTDSPAMALAAKLPIAMDTMPTDVQRIEAVLTSNSVSDAVIDKFKLQERYNESYRELTRKALWSHCWTSVDRKSSVVSLTCEDKDPKFAMELSAYFGEVGNHVFGRVSASAAREERKFLENQVVNARKDVDEASQKLREFQEKHKVVDLPEQSKAVISAMASIQGELISKQLELSYVRGFSARTEASVVQLEQQIAIMQSKLAQLEEQASVPTAIPSAQPAGAKGSDAKNEFFPSAMQMPSLRFELEQLLREQKIRETVFFLTTQRFEMAKIDEARDTSTFQILDYPTLPTYKSRPKRMKILILGLMASIAVACAWILVAPRLRRSKA